MSSSLQHVLSLKICLQPVKPVLVLVLWILKRILIKPLLYKLYEKWHVSVILLSKYPYFSYRQYLHTMTRNTSSILCDKTNKIYFLLCIKSHNLLQQDKEAAGDLVVSEVIFPQTDMLLSCDNHTQKSRNVT